MKVNCVFILTPSLNKYITDNNIDCKTVNLKYINLFPSFLKLIAIQTLIIPFEIEKNRAKTVLTFGNFLIMPARCKSIVLMHHPYLVDDNLYNSTSGIRKITEGIKRIAFTATHIHANHIVVQSSKMKSLLQNRLSTQCKKKLQLIPNPLSQYFSKFTNSRSAIKSNTKKHLIIYPSRFYAHKNHQFLINVAHHLEKQLNIELLVTIDENIPEAASFLKAITENNLPIRNLGEISQNNLAEIYMTARALIFPSKSETFGNPLIEAAHFGLPIILPDLEYARSVAKNGATYYPSDQAKTAAAIITEMVTNEKTYLEASNRSTELAKQTLSPNQWANEYLSLCDSK